MKNRLWNLARLSLVGFMFLSGSFFGGLHAQEGDVYRWGLMHPVDYWWSYQPSDAGVWDYFSPVRHRYEPLPVLMQEKVPVVNSNCGNPAASCAQGGSAQMVAPVIYGSGM